MTLGPEHGRVLLEAARASIRSRLDDAGQDAPPGGWPAPLDEPGASFVTLNVDGALRGCIGSIVPGRALGDDVWSNARRAAFEDPRFEPLARAERPAAALEIAVLGPLEPLAVDSERALLAVLRPGVDGLLLRLGEQRATFLPKVWRTLPVPSLFVRQLERKLGVEDAFRDPALEVHRYQVQEFAGPLAPADEPAAAGTMRRV